MTARKRRPDGREIDRHDIRVKSIIHDFAINPRFRREIEAALRLGPSAVFDLLEQIALEQDLDDAMAMIKGIADNQPHHPDVTREVLGNAMVLIEGVRKAFEDGFLAPQRRRP